MSYTIGVLGGMGTYATIHLFQQYAILFPAEKEWDRPRIIIDNRCTMPSRVRAFLYNEKKDQLVAEMSESISNLVNAGCNKIILACNTSHLFLPEIYRMYPDYKEKIENIIDACVNKMVEDGVKQTYLLGTEGTIESKIYQNKLKSKGIFCDSPAVDEYNKLRDCIEAVKINKYPDRIEKTFLELVNRHANCILGCTELPILYEKYKAAINCTNIYDPLYIALNNVRLEYEKNIHHAKPSEE
ncbi:aspartate/glutamate racemase family protein [Butyrivibrio sp. VCB2006]|uniref:aspartate/glutamate racemase family protein n=1 Tax=Butyrivibrio sp. VCB2006 TaxID=1280679 RepID=UPI000408FCBB|nr:amino acid racemase [Butyrivibrio sp. VCB2006]